MPGPILLLGGAGFLGGHILDALRERGRAVRVFDRARPPTDRHSLSGVEFIEGDFGNRGDLTSAVQGCEIVIHLISTTLPRTSNDDPAHDLETNVVTTVRFLDIARQSGVRKVVFASSGGTVYGVARKIPIPEDHETMPLCSYGIHKLAIERYLDLYHLLYGLDYCILRMSNPYGEGQRPDAAQGAVSVFLDKALRGEGVEVWGDGSVIRDYVHVRDVARAFCLAIEYSGSPKIFNIGSGRGLSLRDLLGAIESLLGRPVTRHYGHGRPLDVPINVLDISNADTYLDWRPEFSFHAGLQRTLEWLQSAERTAGPLAGISPAPFLG
jgi:UDP-glucose 4-epimerase